MILNLLFGCGDSGSCRDQIIYFPSSSFCRIVFTHLFAFLISYLIQLVIFIVGNRSRSVRSNWSISLALFFIRVLISSVILG